MEHYFNVEMAEKHGINAAVVFNAIKEISISNYKCCGALVSIKLLEEWMPYMSRAKISKTLKILESEGLIFSIDNNLNGSKFDRTKWYFITDKVGADYANKR